jgi:hypothetical protein
MNSYVVRIHICMNSYLKHCVHRIYEFKYYMNSCILKKNPAEDSNYAQQTDSFCHTTTDLPRCIVFLQDLYYLYYMILMSEEMMSQSITDEFITGTTNITLLLL